MPRVPIHTVETAPEGSRAPLEALRSKYGRILNIHGEMAHAPALLHAYAALNGALGEHGSFDAATREAIALAVGAADHCEYCQAAHTMAARKAGFSEEQTLRIRNGDDDFDPRLAALLRVVREVARNVGSVSDATWSAALEAGWSDVELVEAFGYVVANLFTNYFNHMVDTPLDLPAAPQLESVGAPGRATV